MQQKGFSTILGLCLILVIALTVRGIQEAETNHAYETADFQTEMELQNAAESGIVAAVADVHSGKRKLMESQHKFKQIYKTPNAKNLGRITVNTWGKHIKNFQQYEVNYNDAEETKNVAVKSNESDKNVYFFFSIAQAKNNHTGGMVYRRATAYVTVNDDDTIADAIHFMETPMSTYELK